VLIKSAWGARGEPIILEVGVGHSITFKERFERDPGLLRLRVTAKGIGISIAVDSPVIQYVQRNRRHG
jgi:hypothetical protein